MMHIWGLWWKDLRPDATAGSDDRVVRVDALALPSASPPR